MTKKELLEYFEFNSEEEKEEAEFYIAVKGIVLHTKILKYLDFNFHNGQKISWESVSGQLRQDKLLRDKLYIYLATLEEYIRAYIANKYEDDVGHSFWINGIGKRNRIRNNIEAGLNLFDILEEVDFGTLIQQVKKLPEEDIIRLFGDKGTDQNIEAVRELRNAVSHHKFMFSHKFLKCDINGVINDTLESNIKNLRQLLPEKYRFGTNGSGGITGDMRKCKIFI